MPIVLPSPGFAVKHLKKEFLKLKNATEHFWSIDFRTWTLYNYSVLSFKTISHIEVTGTVGDINGIVTER